MAIELSIQSGPHDEPRTVRFDQDVVTIGRDPTSDIVFDMAGDLQVSTRHAEIQKQGDGYVVVDKDSTNGTYVNGVLARWAYPLRAGHVINLGRGGPELRVRVLNGEVWHETLAIKRRPGPMQTHPLQESKRTEDLVEEVVESRTRMLRIGVAAVLVSIVVLGGAGLYYLRTIPVAQGEWTDANAATISKANDAAIVLIESEIAGPLCALAGCEGTGFVITQDGLVVTNRHVVMEGKARATSIRVKFANTDKWIRASLVRIHADTAVDLALLQLSGPGPYPSVADVNEMAADVPVGSTVMTIGFPSSAVLKMVGSSANQIAKTLATRGTIGKELSTAIQIDATANHGSSGSPVFDRHGHVIGVVASSPNPDLRIINVVPAQFIAGLRSNGR